MDNIRVSRTGDDPDNELELREGQPEYPIVANALFYLLNLSAIFAFSNCQRKTKLLAKLTRHFRSHYDFSWRRIQ